MNPEPDTYAETAELYDHVQPYAHRKDVAFFAEMARESGGPVLEVGCGTGRVLIPTARAGIEIWGLDLSPRMLGSCKRKLAQEPEDVQGRVKLAEGDMRSFDLGRTFKLITMPFRPFQHLIAVEDQLACLACVHKHLAPDGRFILDLFNPSLTALTDEMRKEGFGHEPEVTLPDGSRMKRWARIAARNYFEQYQDCELIYDVTHPGGRTEQFIDAFKMRYLFRFEAEHLLVRSGFEVEVVYADYDKSLYGSKYPGELIFVAKRK